MIFYITVLRAIAAILITNAHYNNVYPIEVIANGGLLGDVIFFSVSGFCLYNLKDSFFKWYKKRLIRIYPAVWIITIAYLLIGFYTLNEMNIFQYFIYPTYYHFIASIVVLYILYYVIIKNSKLNNHILIVMIGCFVIQMIIYLLFYDKTYYHIDTVREPMIRFLFMEAMLLGAYFRKNEIKLMNKNKLYNWIFLIIAFISYFGSKLLFSKGYLVEFQIVNQILLFILLYLILKCFSGINNKLENMNEKVKSVINFIAKITLEIYLVQYVIIPRLVSFVFPLNWILITVTILISAYILHVISKVIIKKIEKIGESKI